MVAEDTKVIEEQAPAEKEQTAEEVVDGEGGKPPADDEKDGVKADDKPVSIEELESKIIRQLEYYFSDANLTRDKFLRTQMAENEGGWVTLDVLLTFKRLASLTKDKEVICNAIAKSKAGLIEVSEDRDKLRRNPELPIPEQNEDYRKELMSRSAYAKGFPLDLELTQLLDYFSKYEGVLNVLMRKYLHRATKTHKFKGSVFVCFATVEQARAFVDLEKAEYEGRPLLRKMQNEYVEEKREEFTKKKELAKSKKEPEEEQVKLPSCSVLQFKEANADLTRELIRAAIEKATKDLIVAFIDFNKGDPSGHIRFDGENNAKDFLALLENNKLKINDSLELELTTLDEEAEKAFLKKAVEDMKNRRKTSRSTRKRRGPQGHYNQKKQRN